MRIAREIGKNLGPGRRGAPLAMCLLSAPRRGDLGVTARSLQRPNDGAF